jgi:hypothetical protein
MSTSQTSQFQQLGPVVPFPAVYIDAVMPALSDPEWRVLCIVIRQTLGWRDEGNQALRKSRDWLSHSQLKGRTGKSGDAISRAVDSLIRSGLILVETEDGRPLSHPSARRRARTRLYYRLALLPQPQADQGEES